MGQLSGTSSSRSESRKALWKSHQEEEKEEEQEEGGGGGRRGRGGRGTDETTADGAAPKQSRSHTWSGCMKLTFACPAQSLSLFGRRFQSPASPVQCSALKKQRW